ncbi:Protein of unknown function [Propionibacterium freudenreichii]|nr:Protein of unknown function [Propionibacterium freudenreichii]
MLKKDGSRVED